MLSACEGNVFGNYFKGALVIRDWPKALRGKLILRVNDD
jgi:hypothetical protein